VELGEWDTCLLIQKWPINWGRFAGPALIEMLGEFFLIYDEGRRCKVIYDENIFPHI
jgi:hypothetical protein